MNHRVGLLVSLVLAGVGALIVALIILTVDPGQADLLVRAAFFAGIFLALAGLLTPAFFWGRVVLSNREVIFAQFSSAARQATLLGLFLTGLLLLQSLRALSWWDAVLMAAGAGFIELAMRSRM